jgi:hypothetical protein
VATSFILNLQKLKKREFPCKILWFAVIMLNLVMLSVANKPIMLSAFMLSVLC